MKLSCLQENLSQGLNIVSHVSDKNTSLPILNNVLIKTENKNLKLVATNLEIGVYCLVRGKVDEDGEITVPARILNDYVSLLPNDKVDIANTGDEININCIGSSTKIKGTPASDFPLIPSIEKEKNYCCEVDIQDFKEAIGQVIFSLSSNESRPEISGIFISAKDNILTMVATDSFRLAEKKIKIISQQNNDKITSTIIPYRTLGELGRILASLQKDDEMLKDQDNLKIYITENQILFSCRNVELISRVIDAKYPDYTQIIPQESKTLATLNIKSLINSAKAASLFAKVGIYDISLSFDPAAGKVKISSLNNQLGENQSEIDAKIEGEPGEVILNYRFLLDGLQNMNTENIILKVTNRPCLLEPATEQDKKNYIYLIMPIKQ